jgi:hypothetical protein
MPSDPTRSPTPEEPSQIDYPDCECGHSFFDHLTTFDVFGVRTDCFGPKLNTSRLGDHSNPCPCDRYRPVDGLE